MHFERLTDREHPMYEKAMELYRISFPPHEQREQPSQIKILGDEAYHFDLIYDEDLFLGVLLYWETTDFIYVEHFCILPERRNRNYGQRVLGMLGERKKPVILEIDPPVDEVSVRRKGFYERCGFVANPYPHVHPPYHKNTRGHDLVVMSSPTEISPASYDGFQRYLDHHVMDLAFEP